MNREIGISRIKTSAHAMHEFRRKTDAPMMLAPTFNCHTCGEYKLINGRQSVGRVGGSVKYQCAVCAGALAFPV